MFKMFAILTVMVNAYNEFSKIFQMNTRTAWILLLLLFSSSAVFDSLWPHGLQHAVFHVLHLFPRVCSNSCPSSWWFHPTISSSVFPFSSHLQSFPALGSFPVSQFFLTGGQRIGVLASTSVLPINIQCWFPLGLIGLISLQSKGLTRVFSNATVQKQLCFCAQLPI